MFRAPMFPPSQKAELEAKKAKALYDKALKAYEIESRKNFQIRLQNLQSQPQPSLQPGSKNKYFDHPKYVPLPSPGGVVVRPLTDNNPSSPVKPEDSCFFYSSFIRGLDSDNEGKKFFISYGFKPWYQHPLYQMISVIAEGTWIPEHKCMFYHNEGHPLLELILTNSEPPSHYPLGWQGSKMVLLNVIDRGDNFCRLHRESKVLVKTASYNEAWGNWVSSYGVPPLVASEMRRLADKKNLKLTEADFLVFRHHWETPKVEGKMKKFYEVFLPEFDSDALRFRPDTSNLLNTFSPSGALTEEEKQYKLNSFSSMPLYQPSNMVYVLTMLSNFIQEADKEFPGHHFKERFLGIAEEELKAKSELNKDSFSIVVPDSAALNNSEGEVKITIEWKTISDPEGKPNRAPSNYPELSKVL